MSFAQGFGATSPGGPSAVGVPDPIVPADGTQNITGGLEASDTIRSTSAVVGLRIEEGAVIVLDADQDTGISSPADDEMQLLTGAAPRITIKSGNVGIGTGATSPGSQLTVVGDQEISSGDLRMATAAIDFDEVSLIPNGPPAGDAKLWVRLGTPAQLIFTDDAATDNELGGLSSTTPAGIDIGDAGAVGTAKTVARADHQHALPVPAAPVNVTKAAAAAGAATTVARADHKHDVATAAPAQGIGGGNTEGSATSLARSDHDHTIRETGGATDLTVGAIADGQVVQRSGGTLIGVAAATAHDSMLSTALVSTTLATYIDAFAGASINPPSDGDYLVVFTCATLGTITGTEVELAIAKNSTSVAESGAEGSVGGNQPGNITVSKVLTGLLTTDDINGIFQNATGSGTASLTTLGRTLFLIKVTP